MMNSFACGICHSDGCQTHSRGTDSVLPLEKFVCDFLIASAIGAVSRLAVWQVAA